MKPRTSSFIFIMLLVAVIALTIGSPVLLSAAICMLVMLVLALASVVTALLTLQARVVCAATRLLRGEKAAYQAEVSFRSILPVGDIVVNVAGGAGTDSIRFGGMPFRVYRASGEKVFQHRGVYAPVSGSVWVTDVFDLFTFRRTLFAAGGEAAAAQAAASVSDADGRHRAGGGSPVPGRRVFAVWRARMARRRPDQANSLEADDENLRSLDAQPEADGTHL